MASPSRLMPAFVESPPIQSWRRGIGYGVLVAMAGGYVWLIWRWPLPTLAASIGLAVVSLVQSRRLKNRLQTLAEARGGESICTFARTIPVRELDSWVVRAVFEQLQKHLTLVHDFKAFPLRPSDRLFEDLKIDPDDLDEELVEEIAQRTSRSLNDCRVNPYYGKVVTIEDLVRFFCAQPRVAPLANDSRGDLSA